MLFSPLCSGSSGNATFVEAGGLRILIDAGVSAKRLSELMCAIDIAPQTIDAILVTHEHSDHISGISVFSRRYCVPVYADKECFLAMREKNVTVSPSNMRVIEPDAAFYIKSVEILPYSTPHDSARSVGYSISCGGAKCTVMTDVGCVTGVMEEAAANSDILLLEANHDLEMLKCGSYPVSLKRRILSRTGHLNNIDAGNAIVKFFGRGVRNVILGHLSSENNTPELALVTVKSVLEENGILNAVHVTVAKRSEPTGVYEIG